MPTPRADLQRLEPRSAQEPVVLAERDRLVLDFLARQRLAVTPQVESLLSVTPGAAQTRLRALRERRYVQQLRIFDRHPACHLITARGLRAIGSRLPVPRVDLACYQHDVGLGWLWLAARAGELGAVRELYSERELRSHDARGDRSGMALGVGLGMLGPGGREQLHYPDLLLVSASGTRIAVELELTGKGRTRLERIMLGYATDGRVDSILYLVSDGRHAGQVAAAAGRAGIGELVSVRLLDGPPEGAPAFRRTVARERATGSRWRERASASRVVGGGR